MILLYLFLYPGTSSLGTKNAFIERIPLVNKWSADERETAWYTGQESVKKIAKTIFLSLSMHSSKIKRTTILNNITCHFSLILITEKIIDTTIIPKITNVLLIPDVTVQQNQLYMLNSYPYQCFPFEFNDHALKKPFQIFKYMKTLLLEFQ